ncbi:MAG: SIR2 family protein [Ignavibacteriae bacterium]|nr:SIR2 family protein [Ignavibacteriota bacterium]
MIIYHDPLRQLKYLRQTLSQNKKPLGFFLAAGCPLAVTMPTGEPPLIPDIAGLTKFVSEELQSKDKKKKNNFDLLLDELLKTGNKNPNIEDILSFVRGLKQVSVGATDVRGLTEKDLTELEKGICKKIVEKTNVALPNRDTPYHQLAQWIHLIDRDSPIECFTTNYDLLTEQAFEETGVTYFDGFVGSREPFFDLRAIEDTLIPKHWTRLWKVHGSINWFLNSKQEVYRSTDVNSSDSYIIHPSHLKYDESRKMPYLALIDRLNSFLRQTSAVLITSGYSFGDTHLNDTIVNALKANPTAMVIALLHDTYSYKDAAGKIVPRYEKAFSYAKSRFNLSAWTFDEAVIGGQQGKWKVTSRDTLTDENLGEAILETPEIIKAVAPATVDTTIYHYQLQLGNFAKLGNFLQELIGKEQFKIDDAK